MIHVRVEAVRNINNAAEESKRTEHFCLTNKKMKEVIKVVLLDELKASLLAYEEPLKDLRDSL